MLLQCASRVGVVLTVVGGRLGGQVHLAMSTRSGGCCARPQTLNPQHSSLLIHLLCILGNPPRALALLLQGPAGGGEGGVSRGASAANCEWNKWRRPSHRNYGNLAPSTLALKMNSSAGSRFLVLPSAAALVVKAAATPSLSGAPSRRPSSDPPPRSARESMLAFVGGRRGRARLWDAAPAQKGSEGCRDRAGRRVS